MRRAFDNGGIGRRHFGCLLAGAALAASPLRAASATEGETARIVALEQRIVETLLALGIVPLAMQDPQTYRRWVVEPALPEGVIDLGTEAEPNLELTASLRPSLLLAPAERPDLERLSGIAPLVSLPMTPAGETREFDHFRHVLERLARLLGREEAASHAVAAVEGKLAAARTRLRQRSRRPIYLVTFVDSRHVWVYGRSNLFQDVLNRLGLENAWQRQTSFEVVGIDRLADREDAQLLFIENNFAGLPQDLIDNPVWRSLPFVRAGRVGGIASVTPFGAFPTAGRFARLLGEASAAL